MNLNTFNLVRSSLIAAAVTTIFIVAITIVGELYKVTDVAGKTVNPLKELLKALHGHHWVGKGVWAVGLFFISLIIMYLIDKKVAGERNLERYVSALTITAVVGTLILYGFFTYEYFIAH